MKKVFFIALFATMSICAFAQDNLKASFIYCEIVGTQKFMSNKVSIEMDYGQAAKFGESKKLRGDDGKPVVFNSMVDAMNMMGAQGWEFVQAYVVTAQNQNVYHWLLKYSTANLTQEEIAEITADFKTSK